MRLTVSVAIESRKVPTEWRGLFESRTHKNCITAALQNLNTNGSGLPVPFPFGRFSFLEVTDDGKVLGGKETIIDHIIVLPAIPCAGNIVSSLLYELTILEIVKFEAVLLENASHSVGLDPQVPTKDEMKTGASQSDERHGTIFIVG